MNDEKKKALQSLKTARGQIDGIIKMIEDDRYCIDIANQLMAVRPNMKRFRSQSNSHQCIHSQKYCA